MFGHHQGAFTGASYSAQGCFRAADGGTIFLDEIGELEPSMQAKLLRVLQENAVVPVGSHEEHPVNVRVLAATNRDLRTEVSNGRFREDLYYRLAVVSLRTLPLCNRIEDVELLADYLLSSQCVKHGLPFKPLSSEALEKLERYHWPGNVRELQNVLERAVVFSSGDMISAGDLVFDSPLHEQHLVGRSPMEPADGESEGRAQCDSQWKFPGEINDHWPSLDDCERRFIQATLEHTGNNQAAAARLLGIDRSVLRRRLKKLGITL